MLSITLSPVLNQISTDLMSLTLVRQVPVSPVRSNVTVLGPLLTQATVETGHHSQAAPSLNTSAGLVPVVEARSNVSCVRPLRSIGVPTDDSNHALLLCTTSWPLAFTSVVPVLPDQLPAAQPWTPFEKSYRTTGASGAGSVSYTHLTLPTNREL